MPQATPEVLTRLITMTQSTNLAALDKALGALRRADTSGSYCASAARCNTLANALVKAAASLSECWL